VISQELRPFLEGELGFDLSGHLGEGVISLIGASIPFHHAVGIGLNVTETLIGIPIGIREAEESLATANAMLDNRDIGTLATDLEFNLIVVYDNRGGLSTVMLQQTARSEGEIARRNSGRDDLNITVNDVLINPVDTFHLIWPDEGIWGGD